MLVHAVGHLCDGKDLLRAECSVCRMRNRRQQDHEFIPALAADRVGFAHAGYQALSNRQQEPIANQVAQRVIDVLEPIDIDKQYRQ